jgi:hypothetical protein
VQFHFRPLDRFVRFIPSGGALTSHNVSSAPPELRLVTGKGRTLGPKYLICGNATASALIWLFSGANLRISRGAQLAVPDATERGEGSDGVAKRSSAARMRSVISAPP